MAWCYDLRRLSVCPGGAMGAHAVVIPYPEQGHINPLMQLSRWLASQGILVTFVNTEYTHSRMLRSGHHVASAAHSNIRFSQISDGLPLDFDRAAHPEESFNGVQSMGAALQSLICDLNRQADAPVSCLIATAFLPWTLDVAKKARLPWVVLWPQSLTLFVFYTRLSQILSNPRFPPAKGGTQLLFTKTLSLKGKQYDGCLAADVAETVDYNIPGLPPLQIEDLPSHLQAGDLSCRMQQIIGRQFELIEEAAWVIGNTVEEVETEASDACRARVCSVGPLFNPSKGEDTVSMWRECECSAWLHSKPESSVIYVSFGSMIRLSERQTHEIATGLLESQQFFLWVLRPPPNVEAEFGLLPEGFLERSKERGLVVPWAPQVEVLSHPSVGGFFTHCGWNSTVEGLSLGVPMLTFPSWYDQFTNRMLIVEQWRIGMKLNGSTGDEIGRAVRALMATEEGRIMRMRAADLRECVMAASTEGGSSSRNLQSFIDYVAGEGKKGRT